MRDSAAYAIAAVAVAAFGGPTWAWLTLAFGWLVAELGAARSSRRP